MTRKLGLIGGWRSSPERPRAARVGDRLWHLLPAADAVFGPAGPDLATWLADGSAVLVKDGPQRTTYRLRLPGGTAFLKQCRVNGPRAWLRELVRPPKARLEFENALALRSLGLPTAEPLAWAARPDWWLPGESLVVTRCLEQVAPFESLLAGPLTSAARRRVAVALGRLFARLHEAGIAHPDPHPGNLLTEGGATDPRFTLIDVHDVRFGPPLGPVECAANLVLLNRWFQVRASRADRLRFWTAYAAARGLSRDRAKVVERRTVASNIRFWAVRFPRYLRSSRHFRRLKRGSIRGHAVRDLPDAVIERLLANPDAPFADPTATVLKDSRTATVVAFAISTPNGPRRVVYKRFRVRSWWRQVKNLFRRSPAMRAWLAGHSLLDRMLPTARPLLMLERRPFGLPGEGYLLAEEVPDAVPLPAADPTRASQLAEQLGRLIRLMHARRVTHRDLKAANILVSDGRPVLIDLAGVRFSAGGRVRDLARLNASFLAHPGVRRSDKLRFLRAYMNWGLHGRAGWKALWTAADRATRAKQAKNARSGRILA